MPRPTLVFLALLPVLVVALFRVDFLGLNTRAQEFLHVQPHQDVATSGPNGKPPIIMATVSQWTHIEKFCQLASGLVALGYPVTFMGGTLFREHIEKTGATWFEVPGEPTVPGYWLPDAEFEKFLSYEPPSEKASAYGFGKLIWGAVPRYYPALQTALRKVGDYRTIWLHDTIVMASAPLQLGAPGIRPHTDIGVNAVPVCLSSNDTMPFNTGLVPDNSANSKEIHFQAWQAAENSYIMSSWGEHSIKGFAEVGAKLPPPTPAVDVGLVLPDILCPMTIPDFDFPRSDIRPNVRYIGMTKTVNTTVKALPSWWNEIEEAKAKGKKVVAVSRSSIDLLLENIIVPTMNGLAHRDDVIVAIALVNSEVKDFKKQYNVPANARVAKFIPMDLMLPYVDVLVTSAGYGTVQHAIRNGVPMVLVGEFADKAEIGAIAKYNGVAVFNQGESIEPKTLEASVDEIFKNPSYRQKAQAMKKTYAKYDPVEKLDEIIQERTKWFDDLTSGKAR